MLVKRRVRFSIGAMLVLMTGVAVLLNHELQRAKSIETTMTRIHEWNGLSGTRHRASIPEFLTGYLPGRWTEEIHYVVLAVYTKEKPEATYHVGRSAVINPNEFDEVLQLGALDNLESAILQGSAIEHVHVSRVCESTAIVRCALADVSISDDEVSKLQQAFPQCSFTIGPRPRKHK